MLKQVDGEQDEGDGECRTDDPEEGTEWSSPLIHHVGALGDWAAAAGEVLCVWPSISSSASLSGNLICPDRGKRGFHSSTEFPNV